MLIFSDDGSSVPTPSIQSVVYILPLYQNRALYICVSVYTMFNSAVSNSKYRALNGRPLVNNVLENNVVWYSTGLIQVIIWHLLGETGKTWENLSHFPDISHTCYCLSKHSVNLCRSAFLQMNTCLHILG